MARLIQLALLGVLVAVAVTVTASAAPAPCAVSSVGPAVLIDGHLAPAQSNLTPDTTACVGSASRHGR